MRERGLAVVMLGGAGDEAHADKIAAITPGLVNLVGLTRLDEAAAVIERADLVAGVDTGLTHLGIAMDRPTLALFGSTRPYRETGTDRARILYGALPCSPCRRNPTCNGDFTCMRLHTADVVFAAADAVMAK
jgi:heptosyltransferase-1